MKRLTSMLIALTLSANAWALPPEIEADRLLLKAKAALDASDYALATDSLMKAEKLPVKLPDTFYYHYGRASFGSGKLEQARDLLEKYLTLSGTKGKFYQEALVEMNNIEAAIKKRDAEIEKRDADRVAEIKKRDADRVAEIKKRDAEKDAALAQLKQIGLDDPKLAAQGYWRDPKTNLVWMRCSLGQMWDGNTCTGEAKGYTWQDALDAAKAFNSNGGFGGYTDWVVPHIVDLSAIRYCSTGFEKTIEIPDKAGGSKMIDRSCKGDGYQRPTINTTIFPNTKIRSYWSSSPVALNSSYAWVVGFYGGLDGYDFKYGLGYGYVRLVRSSQ